MRDREGDQRSREEPTNPHHPMVVPDDRQPAPTDWRPHTAALDGKQWWCTAQKRRRRWVRCLWGRAMVFYVSDHLCRSPVT
ncbi:hypothetical protein Hanom_Chr16g01453921 [Helianthus anomalus]